MTPSRFARRSLVFSHTARSLHQEGSAHLVLLLTRSYWAKYKFDLGYRLSKKNISYISHLTNILSDRPLTTAYITLNLWFCLLSRVTKQHRQYKHLIFGSNVRSSSTLVLTEIDKQTPFCDLWSFLLPSSKTFLFSGSYAPALAYFQSHVEFIYAILHLHSCPLAGHGDSSYFRLALSDDKNNTQIPEAKTTTPVSSNRPMGVVASVMRLVKRPNDIDIHLDLQLPKLRKPALPLSRRLPASSARDTRTTPAVYTAPYLFLPADAPLRSRLLFLGRCKTSHPSQGKGSVSSSDLEQFPLRIFDPRIHRNICYIWNPSGPSTPNVSSLNPNFNLSVRYHNSKSYNASAFVHNLSRFAIAYLKKGQRGQGKNKLQLLKGAVLSILKLLSSRHFCAAFQFSGRIYGAKKASSFKILLGSVPLNTLDALIDYSSIMQKTRNGTWGFKIWLRRESLGGAFDLPSAAPPPLKRSDLHRGA